jgi:protease-4
LGTITRPKTDDELAIFQSNVDWVYDQFITKVVESRRLDRAVVEEIAQGRVWSGREAVKLHLVDELGGLSAAIKYAASKAKLGDDFRVAEYPRRKQFAETLSEVLEGRHHDQSWGGPVGAFLKQAGQELRALESYNDPRGLYARMPLELHLN